MNDKQQPATTKQAAAPAIAKPARKPAENPFARKQSDALNAGTVSIESDRAIAEAQGKLLIAKSFPRNEAEAFEKIMESCKMRTLAESAFYQYPRGKESVRGPSIRLAEELARGWGNIEFGIRELSQKQGVSEMMAFAWDLQTNTLSSQNFTVKHERHTTQGVKKLTDPRDIYEVCANAAARRLRARILAILSPVLVESAEQRCEQTLRELAAVDPKRVIAELVAAFEKIGVKKERIERRVGHIVDLITADEVVDLRAIYKSIKDKQYDAGHWFPLSDRQNHASDNAATAVLNAAAIANAEGKTPAAVETQPAPEAEQFDGMSADGAGFPDDDEDFLDVDGDA